MPSWLLGGDKSDLILGVVCLCLVFSSSRIESLTTWRCILVVLKIDLLCDHLVG
jgi:hypothetical protein